MLQPVRLLGSMDADRFDVINTDEWPVVQITIQRVPNDISEIDNFQARFLAVLGLARDGAPGVPPEKVSILMNMDGILNATFEHQLRAASFIKDVREYVMDSIYSTALVIENPLARMILEVVTSLQPLSSMHKFFETTHDALAWVRMNRDRQNKGLQPLYT